jgi:hypothetical protein
VRKGGNTNDATKTKLFLGDNQFGPIGMKLFHTAEGKERDQKEGRLGFKCGLTNCVSVLTRGCGKYKVR